MKALGLIETRGLLAAVESLDTMLKAADVSILEKTYVGGGLVLVAVTGDVGAVKAAVEAGVAAVKKLDNTLFVSEHVIPRPHEDLENIIGMKTPPENLETLSSNEEIVENTNVESHDYKEKNSKESNLIVHDSIYENLQEENDNCTLKVNFNYINKATLDNLVKENGIEKTIEMITKFKVVKLRDLVRHKDFGISEETISKASKKLLIRKIRAYYKEL